MKIPSMYDTPEVRQAVVRDLALAEGATVEMLGGPDALSWEQDGADLRIELPLERAESCAVAFRIAQR